VIRDTVVIRCDTDTVVIRCNTDTVVIRCDTDTVVIRCDTDTVVCYVRESVEFILCDWNGSSSLRHSLAGQGM
jgi:hypothetical protein